MFLMQAGFAMLCAGSIRATNVQNMLLQNMLDACGAALGFYAIGYALAYGDNESDDSTTFIGTKTYFFHDGLDSYISWFFQFAFAATAATIVVGTVAERCKMVSYFCYSFFLTSFVYPVVAHSVWDPHGFLSTQNKDPLLDIGMIDFAGSGAVHLTGGCTALVAAIILGPRIGRFYDEDGNELDEPHTFPPHSVALQVLGTFLLWFGWYGFNPGSTLSISPDGYGDIAALAAVTSTLAGASALFSALLTYYIYTDYTTGEPVFDLTYAQNGALSGLVGVTGSCAVVQPWAAVVIGIVSGFVYFLGSRALIHFKIDDAVDGIPVHFANGIWGCIATGLFADPDLVLSVYSVRKGGLFYGDADLLGVEVCGILFILGWTIFLTGPFFYTLKMTGLLRVDPEEERVGLDISKHGGSAYNVSGPDEKHLKEFERSRSLRSMSKDDSAAESPGTA